MSLKCSVVLDVCSGAVCSTVGWGGLCFCPEGCGFESSGQHNNYVTAKGLTYLLQGVLPLLVEPMLSSCVPRFT